MFTKVVETYTRFETNELSDLFSMKIMLKKTQNSFLRQFVTGKQIMFVEVELKNYKNPLRAPSHVTTERSTCEVVPMIFENLLQKFQRQSQYQFSFLHF